MKNHGPATQVRAGANFNPKRYDTSPENSVRGHSAPKVTVMDKVLFVQLPPPRFSFSEAPSNIPLAAGFLSIALHAVIDDTLSGEILEPAIVDVFADQGIVLEIVKRQPVIVAMTLYVWNVERSLFLASNIKKLAPDTKILVGGPEVTPDNNWVITHPAVDAGVFGEGESRIRPLVTFLLGRREEAGTAGFFIKVPAGIHMDTRPHPQWDLSLSPYPYLDKTIAPSRDGTLFLETIRGCPFRCKYCYYHKAFNNIRTHPPGSIEKVLDLAYSKDSGVNEIYLMDPTFNVGQGFRGLVRSMTIRRNARDVALHTELRADLLSREDVILLKDAGLRSAEVGLQTVNPLALKHAGRTGDPEHVARGVEWLKDAGIEVTTGIILGLPNDTPGGFTRTLEWLRQAGAYSVVHPFVLSILPGTDFRTEAEELGIRFHSRPPYYVRSTRTFAEEDFQPALLECENVFDMELDYIPPPSLVDRGPSVVTELDMAAYLSKWIVNLDSSSWLRSLPEVIRKASDPFTIWFRGTMNERMMVDLLHEFAQANPHTCLHVVLELADLPGLQFFDKALYAAAHPDHYLNRAYRPVYGEGAIISINFWITWPDPGNAELRGRVSAAYDSVAGFVWETSRIDEESLSRSSTPLLFSGSITDSGSDYRKLFEILHEIHAGRPEEVLFRDALLQEKWNASFGKASPESSLAETILVT